MEDYGSVFSDKDLNQMTQVELKKQISNFLLLMRFKILSYLQKMKLEDLDVR